MKLARFIVDGPTRLGAVVGDEVADLAAVDPTLPADVAATYPSSAIARLCTRGFGIGVSYPAL